MFQLEFSNSNSFPDRSCEFSSFFNLDAIRNTLQEVQAQFKVINTRLDEPRDPFDDVVCNNMLTGLYAH